MPLKVNARIIGSGSYLPKRIMTNHDFMDMIDTSDEWIVSRTGIKERRIASEDEYPSTMGAEAAKKALKAANLPVEEIDFILVCSTNPDYICPSTAVLIQALLGAQNAAAADVMAACTGYIYGLSIAKAYIESRMYRNILVVATEKMSAVMDYTDRNTCVLFGDGAAAAVVSCEGAGFLIKSVCLGADGELSQLIIIPGGAARNPTTQETFEQRMHYFKMSGKEVFKHAIRRMGSAANECLEKNGVSHEELRWLIPHQANIRIIESLVKNLGIAGEKVYKTLHKYGNTSAASVAIALDELMQKEQIDQGDNLLLVAFGAGLTWGASFLTKT